MEHHAGQVRPWRVRLVAGGLLAGLLVAALVLAPHLAEGTGPQMQDGWHWLSGLLDAITRWWDSLTPGQKIAIGFAIGFAVALLPGLSFGAAFWIAGIATWGLEHHAGIKTFAHDPSGATYDYFANATPGQLALDGLDLALTAIPVGVGATTGRAARQATREFVDNPAAFRAQRRALMDDTGSAGIPGRQAGDPGASAGLRTSTSPDPHVADVANAIEQAIPGGVTGVNTRVPMSNGMLREVDVEIGDVIVQVKGGNARGLVGQIQRTEVSTGRATIGYAPDIPHGDWAEASRQGVRIARTEEELIQIIGGLR